MNNPFTDSAGSRGMAAGTWRQRVGFHACASGGLVCAVLLFTAAQAAPMRTQTIELKKGWNAVYLEVHPEDPTPAAVFGGLPVDVVAADFAPVSAAQFMTNPEADLLARAGWGVWYAPERSDAFLSSLSAIFGQQAYLVHSRNDAVWSVTGTVAPAEVRWTPNAFNLVGFCVHPQAAPTFSQFFSGSRAHRQLRIYRLVGGNWRRVADPSAENLRSGEAFWVYCQGASTYQGPLRVETALRDGLILREGVGHLILRNQSDHPVAATVEQVASGTNTLPLSISILVAGRESSGAGPVPVPLPDTSWQQSLPPLEAGRAIRFPLELRRDAMRSAVQTSLLRVSTDLGTVAWIPALGAREDLATDDAAALRLGKPQPAPRRQGGNDGPVQ